MRNFEIRDDENGIGKVLIVKGDWSDDIASYMKQKKIYSLRLTDSFGFKGDDLSFLSSLKFLRSFELYCWEAKEVKNIEELPQIEVLGTQFKSSQKVDFSGFSNLRVALLKWSKGLESILDLKTLEKLNIQNYPFKNLEPLSNMTSLQRLYLTSRKLESLSGISKLENLAELDLYNCPALTSTSGIELCPNLGEIQIEACNQISA